MYPHYPTTHHVSSIGELVEAVNSIETTRRQILWYRGHSDSQWDVEPSIARGYSTGDERNLTNRFCSRAAIRYPQAPAYDAASSRIFRTLLPGAPQRLLYGSWLLML
jgi:hypothetical protein